MDQVQEDQLEQLEHRIAELETQLIQAQRMTALGELISTTTHEFNNILMTILNYARMGMRHEDKAIRDKAFDKIHTASQRAAKITNSVLCMARNRSEEFEPTDLKTILDHTLLLLERELQKYHISLELEIDENVPKVMAVGNQIQQIILNLLINARQAMLDGGAVVIRLKEKVANRTVELSIRDYGTGIPPERLTRIFEPFYSTKSGPDETGRGGTGVGLANCRCIMENHGGKIRVESTVGKGTCFTLIFPQQNSGNKTEHAFIPADIIAMK